MALSKAIQFVNNFGQDANLRTQCNEFATKNEMLISMGFDENEFEDAINMGLVRCQTYEEAEQYQQIRMWFAYL
jgi:hypothetical protein